MKTLTQNNKRILFGILIAVLGLSKSWMMTATAANSADLASDRGAQRQAPTAPQASAQKGAQKNNRTNNGKPTMNGEQGANKGVASGKDEKSDKDDTSSGGHSGEVTTTESSAPVKSTVVGVSGNRFDPNKIYTARQKNGSTIQYRITDLSKQTTQGKDYVNGELQDTTVTETVASITCLTCGNETSMINVGRAGSMTDVISAVSQRLVEDGNQKLDDEKKQKALQAKIDRCEVDEDGNKLKDADLYSCYGEKSSAIADRRDRLDTLRDFIEDNMINLAKDPESAKEFRQNMRALRSSVGGDAQLRRYLTSLTKYQNYYSQVGMIARDEALNPTHRAYDFMALSNISAGIGYNFGGGFSEGTQAYMDIFRNDLLQYTAQAESSPFDAYNRYWNFGSGGNTNSNNMFANNNPNFFSNNNIGSAPMGFQPTASGPNGMMTPYQQPNTYSPYNIMNRQSSPQMNCGGYACGGTQGLPPFRSING